VEEVEVGKATPPPEVRFGEESSLKLSAIEAPDNEGEVGVETEMGVEVGGVDVFSLVGGCFSLAMKASTWTDGGRLVLGLRDRKGSRALEFDFVFVCGLNSLTATRCLFSRRVLLENVSEIPLVCGIWCGKRLLPRNVVFVDVAVAIPLLFTELVLSLPLLLMVMPLEIVMPLLPPMAVLSVPFVMVELVLLMAREMRFPELGFATRWSTDVGGCVEADENINRLGSEATG